MNEINLEPNYSALLYRFTKDMAIYAHILETSDPLTVSAFRSFMVSLNIAAQATVNSEGLLFLRQEIDKVAKQAVAEDEALKAAQEEFDIE